MMKLLSLLIACLLAVATPAFAQKSQAIEYDDFQLHNARATTHDGTFVSVDRSNTVSFDVLISGTSATVVFRLSGAARNGWQELTCYPSNSTSGQTSTSESGLFTCNIAGGDVVSARVDECTSCSVSVVARRTTAVLGGGSGGGSAGWPSDSTVKSVTWANSEANALVIGDGTRCGKFWGDTVLGFMFKPCILGDVIARIWTNFNYVFRDEEAGADILTIDPDAASRNLMYQFGTNYKPLLTILVPLEPRGAATSTAESLNTNFEKQWFLTVTDANTDAADFSFPVTAKMAGATTATFRLVGVSKHATPSGNIDFDCAMQTYTPGTDTFVAHATTGEVTVLLTPATQYRPVATTSASHTINGGALVAGDVVFGSCEVDAGATTSAQMSDFRLWGYVQIQFHGNSLSD